MAVKQTLKALLLIKKILNEKFYDSKYIIYLYY